nr:MAG TPA: hypothetical protein [Bacteriophage sp.]
MESILEYHIRNIKERTGIEFSVEEGSTWDNPSLRYWAAKELFHVAEDKTGVATVEDCFKGITLQEETLDSKIKKIPQNAVQSTAIAKLTKGDLDFDLTTWLDDLRKAEKENVSAFNMTNDTGYLMATHGILTVLMNEMTDIDVAGYIDYYRQTLKNNIKMNRERLNMTDNEWRHQSWLSTLYGVARQYVHLLGKGKQ